jgi:hypothetical protein
MFKKGDVVKYKGNVQSWKDKEFTVVEKYRSSGTNAWFCIRNGMSYSKVLHEDCLELVESIPKFSTGAIVDMKSVGLNTLIKTAIVQLSNHMGSIVRYPMNPDGHNEVYVPNSRLRIPK